MRGSAANYCLDKPVNGVWDEIRRSSENEDWHDEGGPSF